MLYGSRIGGAPVLGGYGGLGASRIGGFGAAPVLGGFGAPLTGGLYGSRLGGFGGLGFGGLQTAQFGGLQTVGQQQVLGSQNAAQVVGSQHGSQGQAAQVVGSQHSQQVGALQGANLGNLQAASLRQGGLTGLAGVQTVPLTTGYQAWGAPLAPAPVVAAPLVGGLGVGALGASFVGTSPYAAGLGLVGGNSAIIHPALAASGRLNGFQGMLASLPRVTTEVAPVQMENTIVDVEEVPVGYQYINHGIRRIPDNTPEFNQIMTELNNGSIAVGSGSFVGNNALAVGGSFVGAALPGFGLGAPVVGGLGAAPLFGHGLAGMTTSIAPGAGLYGSYAGAGLRGLPLGAGVARPGLFASGIHRGF